jgi:anti-sigma factor RsiW
MNCDSAKQRVEDRFDGTIQTAESEELDQHLESCSACAAWFEEMSRILGGLDALRLASAKEMAAVAPSAKNRMRLNFDAVTRLAAAIGIVVVGGALLWWASTSQDGADLENRVAENTGLMAPSADVTIPAASVRTVRLELEGASAGAYLAVEADTSDPRVHMFWLHKSVGRVARGSKSDGSDSDSGASLERDASSAPV